MGNKVEGKLLEAAWIDSLRNSGGPGLRSQDVRTSMCYGADVPYRALLSPLEGLPEAAGAEADVLGAEDIGQGWYADLPPIEQGAVLELAAEVGAVSWVTDAVVTRAEDSEE